MAEEGRTALNDKSTGLEVEEDIDFERKEWKVERIAWVGTVAVGDGPPLRFSQFV